MPAASSTDVREWWRQQGNEIGSRGAIPAEVRSAYADAHPGADPDGEGDYPPADVSRETTTPAPPVSGGEKRPRRVRASSSPASKGGGWRALFGGRPDPKKKGAKTPRESLADFAEETWGDLALLTAGLPPVSRMLAMQAPYAGLVLDDAVQGTPVDGLLQPLARFNGSYRALSGLIGPPLMTMLITTQGRFTTDEAGHLVAGEDGRPIPDDRTAAMFGMLRYSLLQMAKVSDLHADTLTERAEESAGRMMVVNAMVDAIFGFRPTAQAPPPGAPPAPPGDPGGGPAPVLLPTAVFAYPPPPHMDTTGADPARMAAGLQGRGARPRNRGEPGAPSVLGFIEQRAPHLPAHARQWAYDLASHRPGRHPPRDRP